MRAKSDERSFRMIAKTVFVAGVQWRRDIISAHELIFMLTAGVMHA